MRGPALASPSSSDLAQLPTGFTPEQQHYLQGFFAGTTQRAGLPFAGHLADGTLTNDPAQAPTNLAAATAELPEPIVFGTPISDLCREELWKHERNSLDIWDELLAHAAENRAPNDEWRFRFKFHGLFYVSPAQDSFMLRLRAPGGTLTSHQMRGLATVAERWGAGRADLTTRANLQIREFAPRHIVDVLNAIGSLGLTSRGSGADNLRNITASPISGLDPAELLDVQPLADALQNYISNSRDLFGLPRKFNVAFDNGGSVSVLADTNDIGFVAVRVRVPEGGGVPAGVYLRVLLSGITGHRQFATDCGFLLRPDQAVATAAAMIRVFNEHGDRTDRKKARLKYLIDRWGVPRFLAETEKRLAFPIIRFPASGCDPRRPIDRDAHLGVHQQSQPGLHYIGVVVPVGHLPVSQMRALASVADQFGSGDLRLTVWQNLLLPNIPTENLPAAQAALQAAGLDISAGTVLSGTVACTGNRGCRFASTDTKSHAVTLARSIDSHVTLDHPVNLHVTGCPNSCAQHYIGDLGLLGIKVGGEEGYQVSLGGGADVDQGLAREFLPAIRFTDLPPVLHRLFTSFNSARAADETFLAFTRRHTVDQLRSMCLQEIDCQEID